MPGKKKDPNKTYSPTWGGPGRGGGPKQGKTPSLQPVSLKLPPELVQWLKANVSNRNSFIVEAIQEKIERLDKG